MKYSRPILEIFRMDDEEIICTSTLITDPTKPYPGEGEDGEDWFSI